MRDWAGEVRARPGTFDALRSDLRLLTDLHVLPLPRGQIWLLAASVVLSSLCLFAIGRGIRIWTDALLDEASKASGTSLFTYVAVSAVLASASGLRIYAATNLGEEFGARLRIALFRAVLGQDLRFFETNAPGTLNAMLIADISTLQLVVRSSLSPLIRNGIVVTGAGLLMAWTDWRLTALSLLILPLPVAAFLGMSAKQRHLSSRVSGRIGILAGYSSEVFDAIGTIKMFGREEEEVARFSQRIGEARALALRLSQARGALLALSVLLGAATLGAVLMAGGHAVAAGRMTTGTFSSFLFFLLLAAASCATLGNLWSGTIEAAAALKRIMPHLRTDSTPGGPRGVFAPPVPSRAPMGIAFEAVTFRYPARPDRSVLDAVSFDVAPGETVAIAGRSGAGKSTLIRLLLRFDAPDRGRVLVGGQDIAELDPATVRSWFAVVPQNPFIFSTTLAENIRHGRSDASDAQVATAAASAGVHLFANDLAEGPDTHLGERGVRLSAGQRQRVGIARALVRDTPILILDEATSALDAWTEAVVHRTIFGPRQRPTTLVIAHRLSTLLAADRVVVLNGGRMVATGRHDDLLHESEFYRSLLRVEINTAEQPLGVP
ncbi:hypothetical protein ASG51_19155 [Methylobacterium sp. Leaf465]|uniref:ABC transporter ATP-binding protein n=1 Tax=Methylobacterium sp. Leaf465 TaxID=1736385 RepID=UPI0006F382EF|nr:ABC transporter transmembrane domain-containing protein [Methylobacterium sp. Leaf465]KQT82381.1 hypothetical protein ASG51_19155 [Methylobacterium sp. Leaf465]